VSHSPGAFPWETNGMTMHDIDLSGARTNSRPENLSTAAHSMSSLYWEDLVGNG
ncbi:hypothetical protein KI387_018007, partial [Taxus chinensis]